MLLKESSKTFFLRKMSDIQSIKIVRRSQNKTTSGLIKKISRERNLTSYSNQRHTPQSSKYKRAFGVWR